MIHRIRWTLQKITQRLDLITPLVYRKHHYLPPFRYMTLADALQAPPVANNVADHDWTTIEPDSYWGTEQTNFVMRTRFRVPTQWGQDEPIALHLSIGESTAHDFVHPEALVYIDGLPHATCDRYHQEIRLQPQWCDGQEHHLALHGWTGSGRWQPGTQLLMHRCSVVSIDQPLRDFVALARVAVETARVLDEQVPARGKLLTVLNDAFTLLDTREPLGEAFYASITAATSVLRQGIEHAGVPLDVDIVATGHAHIDVAWLWPLAQTRQKASRTFHTVQRLMEQFPDYHFTQSQPQLYEFVRQDYPALFEQIQQRVAQGRWEAIGGMWVEADCNISGPESLARQFLLGRSFYAEHFGAGVASHVLWLPDVFGYSWAIPQLMQEANIPYFFTIKLSWNQYNRIPYDSFWWQGLDGTRVLTHFSPTPPEGSNALGTTYNGLANPYEILHSWEHTNQKDTIGHDERTLPMLTAFGYGDGGGGPTREMLENLRIMQEFPALPRVRQASVQEFFQDLEQTAGDTLPTWNGELYFELHRGTYTSQSRNKRANRKSEFALHDAEFLAVQASLLDHDYLYPFADLQTAWQLVCLNQFHDIIPGSSIHEVYVDSQRDYRRIAQIASAVREQALAVITVHSAGDLLLVNTTSSAREDLAFWSQPLAARQQLRDRGTGEIVPVQRSDTGTWIAAGSLPQTSTSMFDLVEADDTEITTALEVTPRKLENRFVRVELNEDGDITSIYDKLTAREVLPAGKVANQFQAFEDRPINWDAWDIDIFYDDKQWLAEPAHSITVKEQGPLRAEIEIRRRVLSSEYTQNIALSFNSARVDITTNIDWRERHILLKAAFPVEILSPVATYEIQWGNVQRPIHRNTSWDWARFETCAQKWVDLSEGDYGVSLLNDCKYGYDIHDNVIRISLLRSPTMPDPEADQGQHTFTYSVLPHQGGWGEKTIHAAYQLNDPIVVAPIVQKSQRTATATRALPPLFSLDVPNIIIETVKQAEDNNGIIVRLYECQRRRGKVTLTTGFDVKQAWRVNILEEPKHELVCEARQVTFSVHPYEIVTLRVLPA